jgi:hypothetical protein
VYIFRIGSDINIDYYFIDKKRVNGYTVATFHGDGKNCRGEYVPFLRNETINGAKKLSISILL